MPINGCVKIVPNVLNLRRALLAYIFLYAPKVSGTRNTISRVETKMLSGNGRVFFFSGRRRAYLSAGSSDPDETFSAIIFLSPRLQVRLRLS